MSITLDANGIMVKAPNGTVVFNSARRMPHIVGVCSGASSFSSKYVGYMGAYFYGGPPYYIFLYGLYLTVTETVNIPIADPGAGAYLMGYIQVTNTGLGANPALQGKWTPWNGSVITRMSGSLVPVSNVADGASVLEVLSAKIVGSNIQITRRLEVGGNISPTDMYLLLGTTLPLIYEYGQNGPGVALAPGEYLTQYGTAGRTDLANLGVYFNYKFYIARP